MKYLLTGGIAIMLTGAIGLSPYSCFISKNKTLSRITGLILLLMGASIVYRALTL